MSAPLAQIRQAALNPPRLARKAIKHRRLFPAIMDGLKADKAPVKYGCAKTLRIISEQRPDLLYPHFDFFVGLLDHENKIFQWEAAFVRSHLARADDDDKFAAAFDRYFSPIPGPVMITAANVIQGGARIAHTRPHLAERIAAEVLKVAKKGCQGSLSNPRVPQCCHRPLHPGAGRHPAPAPQPGAGRAVRPQADREPSPRHPQKGGAVPEVAA